jgi:enoyl-CoA hydratase/carnithine racemase
MTATLHTRREGHCLVLTLDHPGKRNALSPQVHGLALKALDTAAADPTVRAVVLTGANGHFCAGGDLQRIGQARQLPPQEQARSIEAFHGLILALQDCPRPVIAAVEGAAAGAGFSLALACDLIVAAEDARFVLSYGRVGLTPDGGATWFLSRHVPRSLALEWTWLAEPVPSQRLLSLGVVNRVCAPGKALTEALALAERLAAMAPNAVAAARALVRAASGCDLATQLQAERESFIAQLFHDNAQEGIEAFLQRRPPSFR